VTGRLGKPHPEQDQIEGIRGRPAQPRVGRLTPIVISGLDGWSPLRFFFGVQNSAYRFTLARPFNLLIKHADVYCCLLGNEGQHFHFLEHTPDYWQAWERLHKN